MSTKKCNTPQKRKRATKVALRSYPEPVRSNTETAPETMPAQVEAKAGITIPRACYICGRDWKMLQMIGPTTYRCDDCYPGSYDWVQHWQVIPREKRPDIINFYLEGGCHATI